MNYLYLVPVIFCVILALFLFSRWVKRRRAAIEMERLRQEELQLAADREVSKGIAERALRHHHMASAGRPLVRPPPPPVRNTTPSAPSRDTPTPAYVPAMDFHDSSPSPAPEPEERRSWSGSGGSFDGAGASGDWGSSSSSSSDSCSGSSDSGSSSSDSGCSSSSD